MDFGEYPYGRVAAIYDELAAFYSCGQISRSKRHALNLMGPSDRVLFAGVGRGDEALEAAADGCQVTAIDVSPEMLRRFGQALTERNLEAQVLLGDVAGHTSERGYDVVVAHYFLNLFESRRAEAMLDALIGLVRPGGRLVIADFAGASGGWASRIAVAAYYRPVNWIAWALGFCALHPILDYPALLEARGMQVVSDTRFPLFATGSVGYCSVAAVRPG